MTLDVKTWMQLCCNAKNIPLLTQPTPVLPVQKLATAILHLFMLQDLGLSVAAWGATAEVVKALASLTGLTRLNVAFAGVYCSTAPHLATSLHCMPVIKILSLEYSDIGEEGAQLFLHLL